MRIIRTKISPYQEMTWGEDIGLRVEEGLVILTLQNGGDFGHSEEYLTGAEARQLAAELTQAASLADEGEADKEDNS